MTVVTLGELSKLVGGQLIGSADTAISAALPLEAGLPAACITLVDNAKLLAELESSQATAAVVPLNFPATSLPVIQVADPHAAFMAIIGLIRPARDEHAQGIHVQAIIDPTAEIGAGTAISAGATVGPGVILGRNVRIHSGAHVMADSRVGDDCELFPGVVLYPRTVLGARCTIHAGTVLGAHGFGYRSNTGKHLPTGQLGWVELGDDVELGACVTIDRGTYGPTRIGTGTKIDNQVMIGHNCQIGKYNLLCAQVGIAGSCSTGDYVVMAGQVGMKDHTHLSDRVIVAAQAGVMHDLKEVGPWSGSPAMPVKDNMKSWAIFARLPEMRSEMREVHRELASLREQLAQLQSATPVPQPKAA